MSKKELYENIRSQIYGGVSTCFADEDTLLDKYKLNIIRRHKNFVLRELSFTENKKQISDVFNSYLYYGLHLQDDIWVFREWAPHATAIYLIGDFNNWKKDENFRLYRKENGDWEGIFPKVKIHHGMLYRLLVEWEGGSGERLPSHVRRALQDEKTKVFSAQVWQPEESYKWENKFNKKNKNPLIYEAHVGMSTERYGVTTFEEFRQEILPHIQVQGYNTIQLMGIQEHPYYGSFGYHVSNFFAVSSRFGTPEDLKRLIDDAHGRGIAVVIDIVHSHAVKNEAEGLSYFDGTDDLYFYKGEKGYHKLWNSRCFDYSKNEVVSFLLSNCKYWLEEFHFDGFRFDGITSMMYWDHGIGRDFTDYKFYYDGNQDEDAITYLTLANRLIHQINKNAITIAEDVSGMPGLASPIEECGIGFDFRMSMGVPDYWIKLIKEQKDEEWQMGELFYQLTNKRKEEHTISYVESHDQALVGDKTLIFRLIDKDMYSGMSVFTENLKVERGISLHKMIRLITITTAGDGYLNFMGNEWGHPEWIDFPREGNGWSYQYARRQWHLLEDKTLLYQFLNVFDREMLKMVKQEKIFNDIPEPIIRDNEKQILVYKRGKLLLAFNFNPSRSFSDYRFQVSSGKYINVMDTDEDKFKGQGRIKKEVEHFTLYENSTNWLSLYLPSRTGLILKLID